MEGQEDPDEKEGREEGRRQASRKGSACDSSPCGCWSPTSRDADGACGGASSRCPGRTGEHRRLGASMTRPRARGEHSHWLQKSPGQKLCVILRPKTSSTSPGCPQALCGHQANRLEPAETSTQLTSFTALPRSMRWTPGSSRGVSGNLLLPQTPSKLKQQGASRRGPVTLCLKVSQ